MAGERFEEMLSGGHHNSLGRTEEVVDVVFANHDRIEELFGCYFSDDELVRLRTSSAFKRVALNKPDWLVPYIERFLTDIATIEQASTQWTLALLFEELADKMSHDQFQRAVAIVKRNLVEWDDWIVLNYSMQALTAWAVEDAELATWLRPHLEARLKDERKAVAGRAKKMLALLDS